MEQDPGQNPHNPRERFSVVEKRPSRELYPRDHDAYLACEGTICHKILASLAAKYFGPQEPSALCACESTPKRPNNKTCRAQCEAFLFNHAACTVALSAWLAIDVGMCVWGRNSTPKSSVRRVASIHDCECTKSGRNSVVLHQGCTQVDGILAQARSI